MLSPNQNADFLNVHSKRKKENILSHDQANNLKKCKITLNHETNSSSSSSPSSSPSSSSPPSTATNCNKKPPNNLEKWLMMFHQWSHNERISALDALMTSGICEIQQIRYLLTIIEPQLQRDFISLLPKELSLYVLSFLDPPDLLRAAQTSRYWRILCEDNLLWREKCREEGLLEDNEGFNELFIKRISHSNKSPFGSNWPDIKTSSSSSSSSPPPPQSSLSLAEDEESCDLKWSSNQSSSQTNTDDNTQCVDYKFAYLHNKNIEYNWRYGILNHNGNGETLPTFTDHHSNINLQILTAATTANNHQSCANNNRNNSDSSSTLEDKAKNGNVTGNSAMSSLPMQQNKPRKLKEILHLKGHEDHVITCLQFNPTSNIIVSGSDDNTLKVWSSITGRCLQILIGHTGGVWSSQLSADNIVISGSTDRTLRVWNALNGHCLHILYGHTSTVRCMALHDRQVVSGSRDATLRVWNIETGECVHVLVGHAAAVRCVQFNGKLCVSGAYDNWVKVWHVATETCLHTLEGHTNRVYSLQFDGKHIVSGSLDTSIRVWCAQTGKLKHTLIGHQSLTSGMQLRNNILVSGNADSTVRVWDINTGQCLQTLTGNNKHQSAVTCLQFNSKFVITSSDDGTVKLWDLKAGQFIRNLVTLPSGGSGGVVWRIRSSNTKLVCAVGSRNGTEETKLLVLDFETSTNNDMRSSFCNNSVFQEFTEFPTPTLFDDIDNQFQQPPQPTEPTNSPYSLNRLSSFCNNCKHAYLDLDFKLQQLQSAQNQHQPILSSSTLTIPTCTSSSSLNSSLTSTPSSSNLILTSISSISSSSLQSNLSSTATIATSSSLTASTSESVVSKLPMVEKLSASTSSLDLKPSPSLSSNPRLDMIHTDLDCVSADDDDEDEKNKENEENEESNDIMQRTMIDYPANDLYNSDNSAANVQNKSDSNNFSRPKSVPNDDEESQDPC